MSAIVLMALAAVACTDDGGAGSAGGSVGGSVGDKVTTTPSAPTEPTSAELATTSVAPSTEVAVVASTVAIVPVPDDGVPGIDSDDPFCRSWSEFAGSFQALAGASAAGAESGAARLEVVASAAVSSAAQTMADEFPAPIAFEREVFVNDVIGPFARRADRASDELRAVGLSPAEIELLGDVWLGALADAGVDDPEIDVAVPDDLIDAVLAAVEEFSVPAIVEDPSLVNQASAPATFEFLATNCPDQGILGGNDAID